MADKTIVNCNLAYQEISKYVKIDIEGGLNEAKLAAQTQEDPGLYSQEYEYINLYTIPLFETVFLNKEIKLLNSENISPCCANAFESYFDSSKESFCTIDRFNINNYPAIIKTPEKPAETYTESEITYVILKKSKRNNEPIKEISIKLFRPSISEYEELKNYEADVQLSCDCENFTPTDSNYQACCTPFSPPKACLTSPYGNNECVSKIQNSDKYCCEIIWDNLCENKYQNCVSSSSFVETCVESPVFNSDLCYIKTIFTEGYEYCCDFLWDQNCTNKYCECNPFGIICPQSSSGSEFGLALFDILNIVEPFADIDNLKSSSSSSNDRLLEVLNMLKN